MGKFKPFLLGSLLGAGVAICALQFHVVQSQDGFRVVPRTPQPSLGLAYADVRNWDAETWADRPELVRALVAHGSTDLVASSVADAVGDAVIPDNSTLDELRSFLNESRTDTDPATAPVQAPGLKTPENSGSEDGMDDLFTLPFPQDARKKPSGSVTTNDSFPTKSIARREHPVINDVLNAGVNGLSSIDNVSDDRALKSSSSAGSVATGRSAEADTELLEGMLFGEDDSPSDDSQSAYGVFEDVTSTLENRAEEALQRARNGFQQQSNQAVSESAGTVDRYVRDKVRESLSESAASMFSEEPGLGIRTDGPAANGELPGVLKALRDGFDPFVE